MADTSFSSPPATELDPSVPPTRPGLTRSTEGRLVAGVADGLARTWGFRPWLVRLGFIATAFLAGLGIVLYAAGWLVMPAEGEPHSIAQRIVRRIDTRRSWLGFALLILGGFVVGSVADIDFGVLLAAALLVTGYVLYRGDLFETNPSGGLEESSVVAPVYRRQAIRRAPRPRSYLGRLTIGAALLVLGVIGALDAAAIAHPTSRHYAAATVLTIGIGLLVGTVYGRSRGLIALGVLLLPPLALAAVADVPIGDEWESLTVRPNSLEGLSSQYSLPAGNITLDLREVDFGGSTVALDLETRVGNIYVELPPDVRVEAMASVTAGSIRMLGDHSSGLGAALTGDIDGTNGTVVIDAAVRIGSIDIYRQFDQTFPHEPIDGQYVEFPSGGMVVAPRSFSQLASTYRLFGTELVLDLADLPGDDLTEGIRMTFIGEGAVTVIVPAGAGIVATSTLPFENLAPVPGASGLYLWERPGDGASIALHAEGVIMSIEEAR